MCSENQFKIKFKHNIRKIEFNEIRYPVKSILTMKYNSSCYEISTRLETENVYSVKYFVKLFSTFRNYTFIN